MNSTSYRLNNNFYQDKIQRFKIPSIFIISKLVILILLIIPHSSFSQSSKDSNLTIKQSKVPQQDKDIYLFLESLKCNLKNENGFDIKKAPRFNVAEFIKNIAQNGVVFIDPNDNHKKCITKETIAKQFTYKSGKAFEMIAHLAYIYSLPYPQYSSLCFTQKEKNKIEVTIGNWYRLIFETISGKHYLIICEYLQIESE